MLLWRLMDYNKERKVIVLNRKLSKLDELVLDFIALLDDYVIVSGYVSIITGRSRATEDIDLLVPRMDFNEFEILWKRLHENNFECLNTENIKSSYNLWQEHAIRFARKGTGVPNMEFKMIKNDIERYSFENKIRIPLKGKELWISPIEMQIAFKLSLGSEKDIEDAKHLYELFKDKIDKDELIKLIRELNVENEFKLIR